MEDEPDTKDSKSGWNLSGKYILRTAAVAMVGLAIYGYVTTRQDATEPIESPVYREAESQTESAVKQYPDTFEGRLERLKDDFDKRTEDRTFEFLSDVQTMLDGSKESIKAQAKARAEEILNPESRGYLDNSKGLIEDRLGQKEE